MQRLWKEIFRTNRPQLQEIRFKEHRSFKNNNCNSKFSQHLLEIGHAFGKNL
jgi:hypothetical protein